MLTLDAPPRSSDVDVEALIKEARRLRRVRWLKGCAVAAVVGAVVVTGAVVGLSGTPDHDAPPPSRTGPPPVRTHHPPSSSFGPSEISFDRLSAAGAQGSFTATYLVDGPPPFSAPGIRQWTVTVTQVGPRVWSFVASARNGEAEQWINEPCSAGGCHAGGFATYVECDRPVAGAPWRCISGTNYGSSGFMAATAPMLVQQFSNTLPPDRDVGYPGFHTGGWGANAAPPIIYRTFTRESATVGRLRCMSASQGTWQGLPDTEMTWCVTRAGVPALLNGNQGVPAPFTSMKLVSVSPPSTALLEPFAHPTPGDALDQG